MKHFKPHKTSRMRQYLVFGDVLQRSCAMCNVPTVQFMFIPDLADSVWKLLPRVSKVLHLCFHCIFLVIKVVANKVIGPGTAWGWTLVQICTSSVRLFSIASKVGLIWIMCLVEERKSEGQAQKQIMLEDYIQHIPLLLKPKP